MNVSRPTTQVRCRALLAVLGASALVVAACGTGELQTTASADADADAASSSDASSPDAADALADGPCLSSLQPVGPVQRTIASSGQVTLQVRLTSDCNGPTPEEPVSFLFVGSSLGAVLAPSTVLTDPAGTASTTLHAGVRGGVLTVVARHDAGEVQFVVAVDDLACADHCANAGQDCGESGVDCGGSCAACPDPCDGHCSSGAQDCGESGVDCGGSCRACGNPCDGHCSSGAQDCGESGVDCGGTCAPCPDPCDGHCSSGAQDCGEGGVDCGGACAPCADPCDGHCSSGTQDCGEGGVDCGGACAPCPDPCDGHCSSGAQDCGESGVDCGGACILCGSLDDAAVVAHTIPSALAPGAILAVSVTMRNTGDTTWYRDGSLGYKLGYLGDTSNPFLPPGAPPRALLQEGESVAPNATVTFVAPIQAPTAEGSYVVDFRMLHETVAWFGDSTGVALTVSEGVGLPPGACSDPLPPWENERSHINLHCGGTWCDATPICHGCDYCAEIGMPCMPGTGPTPPCTPRCDCPARPEGNPQRGACELYFLGGPPLWRSDGAVIPHPDNAFLSRCEGCTWIEVCRDDATMCNRVTF